MDFNTFLALQPNPQEEKGTDRYYYEICRRLVDTASQKGFERIWHISLIEQAALCVIGYYQDMIADAGLWHGFCDECQRMYGTPVPFFHPGDEYIPYELNPEDVHFLVWYVVAMYSDDRNVYPFDDRITRLASLWYDLLEENYENAPTAEDYHLAHELDVHEEEDQEMIMRLGSWLFLHSWLLTPAFALTSAQIIESGRESGKTHEEIAEELQSAVNTYPTGPLALYLGEWVNLTVHHKLPRRKEKKEESITHPAFSALTSETGGSPVKFIKGYENLNSYLIDTLGWAPGTEHLEQLKHCRDFVLMADRKKGLLVAPDICRCIAAPENECYDKKYASQHAMELLTERGKCPHDLLAYICEKGWLKDARFRHSTDTALVEEFHDFIARCYLQLYYRGD